MRTPGHALSTHSRGIAMIAVALMVLASLIATASPADALEELVDIRVELDLPYCCDDEGPVVFEVMRVAPGDGPELTGADLVENPSDWCGSLEVDIDPDAQTITIDSDDVCDFQTAVVTITSATIVSIELVSDDLWQGSTDMALVESSVAGGVTTIAWSTDETSDDSYNSDGEAVFTYESAAPELDLPASATVGDDVTIAGNLCRGDEVSVTILDDGTEVLTDSVAPGDDGSWELIVSTTDLDPAELTVVADCSDEGEVLFAYAEASLTLEAVDEPDEPAEQPEDDDEPEDDVVEEAVPAEPVEAEPDFTG